MALSVLDLVNHTYQTILGLLVTRTSFFKDIRSILKFILFDFV